MNYYILDEKGNLADAENLTDWATWMEEGGGINRIVAKTEVGPYRVSTVFLGINHRFIGKGPPILWETMIFGPDGDGEYQTRYSSLSDAKYGHVVAIEHAKEMVGK